MFELKVSTEFDAARPAEKECPLILAFMLCSINWIHIELTVPRKIDDLPDLGSILTFHVLHVGFSEHAVDFVKPN